MSVSAKIDTIFTKKTVTGTVIDVRVMSEPYKTSTSGLVIRVETE